MMAAFLYLGAGAGMAIYELIRKGAGRSSTKAPLTRAELPYTVAMVLLDIAAPILLMIGLSITTSDNASLLNNFEIVATSLIALVVFREVITRKLWLAIGLVTVASIILSFENNGAFEFNMGSVSTFISWRRKISVQLKQVHITQLHLFWVLHSA